MTEISYFSFEITISVVLFKIVSHNSFLVKNDNIKYESELVMCWTM
jgi:hypothetical protein